MFTNTITVKGLKTGDMLGLLDIAGKIIYNWKAEKETERFKAAGLAAGHYLLKIMNGHGQVRVNVPVVRQ